MLFISLQKLFSLPRYLTFCFDVFGRVAKRLDCNDKINCEIYDVTARLSNSCKTHIAQYLETLSNQAMKFGQLIDYNMRIIFIEK